MENSTVTTAVASVAAVLTGKILWDWLSNKNQPRLFETLTKMESHIKALTAFHEKTNGAGRPLAYFNNDGLDKIEDLQDDLKSLPVVLANILSEIKALHSTVLIALKKIKE